MSLQVQDAEDRQRTSPDESTISEDAGPHGDGKGEKRASNEKVTQSFDLPPFSSGFFHKDPATAKARGMFIRFVLVGTLMVTVAVWTVLAIYWGAFWKANILIHHLNGWVVDFDGGEIGSAVAQHLSAINSKEQISWHILSSGIFPNGPSDLADAVVKEKCWVAVSINPGATNILNQATEAVNQTYNGAAAVTAFANEARNENGYAFLIRPNVDSPLQEISQKFAIEYAQQLANRTNLSALLSQAPSVITQPLGYTINNLRPFDVSVATAVDFVGLIYLLILAFIIAMQQFGARMQSGIQRRLSLKSLILMRIAVPIISYFWISFMYSVLSLAYAVPFNRNFGHPGFLIHWMMSFCGMMALGLGIEAMITILTPKFIPFFLILWIIANVSVSFFPIEVLPSVFRYGYATPFYNVSRTVRAVLFGTRNEIGLNFGIQIAWIAVSCITLSMFQWFIRRGEVAAWRKSAGQERGG